MPGWGYVDDPGEPSSEASETDVFCAENLFCAGTYKGILDRIAEPVVLGAEIVYGANVTEIYGKSAGVVGNTVNVIAADTRAFEFDEVVVTLPLGWLKKHPRAFVPPFPERLSQAIQNISYGCLEKVSMQFHLLP